eukprot:scaffold11571_cov122-Cylindrotheca_fusiformis.AAC.13
MKDFEIGSLLPQIKRRSQSPLRTNQRVAHSNSNHKEEDKRGHLLLTLCYQLLLYCLQIAVSITDEMETWNPEGFEQR